MLAILSLVSSFAQAQDSTEVVPRVVGTAAPGGKLYWQGNPGDYPGRGGNRNGWWPQGGSYHQCPAGTLPSVLGTADECPAGIHCQEALDDARAKGLAPRYWDGSYVITVRTPIMGMGAAGVWCVDPGDIYPTTPEGAALVAAGGPPPSGPPALTRDDVDQRIADALARQKAEEPPPLPPPAASPPPAPRPAPTPFLTRGGPFAGIQGEVGDHPYFHGLVGGFVTLRLSDLVWFEPFAGFGTDGKSTHPTGYEKDTNTLTDSSGWFLSINGGVRFPVVAHRWVNEEKGSTYVLVSPGLGWIGDDLTKGFTFWGGIVSLDLQAEVWWDRKVPFAVYLETGVAKEAWLNDQATHTSQFGWPLMLGAKFPF